MLDTIGHVDGFDFWVLPIFGRTDFDTQITPGAIFRCDLQHVFLAAHVAGLHVQRLQGSRGAFEGFRLNHFGTNGRVRAGRDAVVTLGTEVRLPDGHRLGDVAFFPLCGPGGQVPSGGKAETGRASPRPASIAAVTVLTKSGAASETIGGRLRGFSGMACNGTSISCSSVAPIASQLRVTTSSPLLL